MSALKIVHAKGRPMIETAKCCVQGCQRSPRKCVEIAGYPVGRLCQRHALEWRMAWDRALEPAETITTEVLPHAA